MNDLSYPNRRNLFLEGVFLLTALIGSVLFCQLRLRLCDLFADAEFFQQMAGHVGEKPWQYRILIPAMAGLLNHIKLPAEDSLFAWAKILEILFMFFTVIAFRHWLFLLLKDRKVASLLSFSLFAVLPFHHFFPRPYFANYWYDTPALLVLILGIIFLYEKRWTAYYVLFLIGTFNRETTCFLTVIYLLTSFAREKTTTLAAHCGAQFVIWMVIKTMLGKIYLDNPGVNGFEWYVAPGVTHYADNIRHLMSPMNYPVLLGIMGFLWIPVLVFHKRIGNDFVKRSLWVFIPYFAGMFLVANFYELRIYAELIPLFLSAFLLILIDLIKSPTQAAPDLSRPGA
ncbi:MAG: hypothetical protein Q8Q59_06940 [Luteolibacter sp.]|jgi:hypothetical protein|nr:hypothetical protein [Luteolibacter sp.]